MAKQEVKTPKIMALISIDANGEESFVGSEHDNKQPIIWFAESITLQYVDCLPALAKDMGRKLEIREYRFERKIAVANPG